MRGAKQRGMFLRMGQGAVQRTRGARISYYEPSESRQRPTWAGVGLLILAGLLALPPAPAGASDRGEIRLRGTVPTVCTVSVSTDLVEMDILRGTAGAPIATVTEQCNAAAGYTISVLSSNSGRMLLDRDGTAIPYSLSYDSAGSDSSGQIQADRPTSARPRQGVLSATLPANPQARAGTYTDTVTVSIIAK